LGQSYLAIVNPAAGGGRGAKLLGPALKRLRDAGIEVNVATTRAPGQASDIARDAYGRGTRHFIAFGGDGTSYEVVNGLFPQAIGGEPPTLGLLPLGTGNSFLRDFTDRGLDAATEWLLAGETRPVDVMRMRHRGGELYYINLLSMGFSADVAALRARRFSGWGELGSCTCPESCSLNTSWRPRPNTRTCLWPWPPTAITAPGILEPPRLTKRGDMKQRLRRPMSDREQSASCSRPYIICFVTDLLIR